jgi:hypothetical protein
VRLAADRGLGSSWDDLFHAITHSAENDVTAWLFQQYAALHALPQRIAALEGAQQTLLAKIPPSVSNASDLVAQVTNAGVKLQQLAADYPAMIADVDRAYTSARQATSGAPIGTVIGDTALVARGIYNAQAFQGGVSDVNDTLKTVVDTLLANGAITPQDAQQIYAESQGTASGWGKYVGYAVVGLVGFWLLKKVL